MLLDFFPAIRNRAPTGLLTFRARLYDGSEITASIADVELRFRTGIGVYRVFLSHIVRLKNIANVVTSRQYLWANKFEIVCDDDTLIIGKPIGPNRLWLVDEASPHRRVHIDIWEIDWLVLLPNHHA